jgi:hypothetical protein
MRFNVASFSFNAIIPFSSGRKAPLKKAAEETDTRFTRAAYPPPFFQDCGLEEKCQ